MLPGAKVIHSDTTLAVYGRLISLHYLNQQRMQDFPQGAPTPRRGAANLLFGQILTKIARKQECIPVGCVLPAC